MTEIAIERGQEAPSSLAPGADYNIRPASPVALTATIHTFDIDLADADRGVYETLALRVARHPSESEECLVTRLIAKRSA